MERAAVVDIKSVLIPTQAAFISRLDPTGKLPIAKRGQRWRHMQLHFNGWLLITNTTPRTRSKAVLKIYKKFYLI